MEVLYQLSYPGGSGLDLRGSEGTFAPGRSSWSDPLRRLFRRCRCEHTFPTTSTEMQMPHFDAYEDLVGKWRWRLVAGNERTVATSGESFDSHWHALRAAENVRGAAAAAQISGAPADGVEDALGAIIERELAESR
jgi:uncharacterized protein YegP (UPF0339 family)